MAFEKRHFGLRYQDEIKIPVEPLVVADTPARPVGHFPTKDSRLKIRIFALAKELDIDSKLLIDYCAKAGITIKNSALASISPEERDRVLDVMKASGSSAAGDGSRRRSAVAGTRDGVARSDRRTLP